MTGVTRRTVPANPSGTLEDNKGIIRNVSQKTNNKFAKRKRDT
jgi:hypothetical protein